MTQGAEVAGAGGTRIERVELRRLHMPLVAPFRTSFGTSTARDLLLVRIDTATAEGWGECVADAEPTLLLRVRRRRPARDRPAPGTPRSQRPAVSTAARVGALLEAVKGHPMAKAALETAVLDAELRAAGVSFADHLGAVADRVPAASRSASTARVPDAARRGRRLPRRGLPADQAQDRAGLGRRAGPRGPRAVRRRRAAAGRRQHRLHASPTRGTSRGSTTSACS